MSSTLTGGCLCGKVRYSVEGEALFTIKCFCRDCQHMSGGGHAPQLAVKCDQVTKSGPLKTFHLKSESGNEVELGFCEECGSPIYKTTTYAPDLIMFFAGSLDDPSRFTVKNRVYEDRRQPWDEG